MAAAPVFAACGTPTIDGILSPGEWDGAVSVRFAAALPELSDGAGSMIPAEVLAMSDERNLYVAFRLGKDTSAYGQSVVVSLDADESGGVSAGDDELVFSWDRGAGDGSALFADDSVWSCAVDTLCSPLDTEAAGGLPAGTSDGGGAIHFGDGETTIELWHPYAGGDSRDVLRAAGQSIPMQYWIRLLTACDVDVNDWPAAAHCLADTSFPSFSEVPPYRAFVLGCGAPPPEQEVVEVRIELKPGDPLPTIDLGSAGSTTVIVLGSDAFDAARIDPATVFFAGAPVEQDTQGRPRTSLEDVDGDGRDDLVAHFTTAALQLEPGVAEATLAGRTVEGRRFHGTDGVRVIGP
jgi:hypothetical protein